MKNNVVLEYIRLDNIMTVIYCCLKRKKIQKFETSYE